MKSFNKKRKQASSTTSTTATATTAQAATPGAAPKPGVAVAPEPGAEPEPGAAPAPPAHNTEVVEVIHVCMFFTINNIYFQEFVIHATDVAEQQIPAAGNQAPSTAIKRRLEDLDEDEDENDGAERPQSHNAFPTQQTPMKYGRNHYAMMFVDQT